MTTAVLGSRRIGCDGPRCYVRAVVGTDASLRIVLVEVGTSFTHEITLSKTEIKAFLSKRCNLKKLPPLPLTDTSAMGYSLFGSVAWMVYLVAEHLTFNQKTGSLELPLTPIKHTGRRRIVKGSSAIALRYEAMWLSLSRARRNAAHQKEVGKVRQGIRSLLKVRILERKLRDTLGEQSTALDSYYARQSQSGGTTPANEDAAIKRQICILQGLIHDEKFHVAAVNRRPRKKVEQRQRSALMAGLTEMATSAQQSVLISQVHGRSTAERIGKTGGHEDLKANRVVELSARIVESNREAKKAAPGIASLLRRAIKEHRPPPDKAPAPPGLVETSTVSTVSPPQKPATSPTAAEPDSSAVDGNQEDAAEVPPSSSSQKKAGIEQPTVPIVPERCAAAAPRARAPAWRGVLRPSGNADGRNCWMATLTSVPLFPPQAAGAGAAFPAELCRWRLCAVNMRTRGRIGPVEVLAAETMAPSAVVALELGERMEVEAPDVAVRCAAMAAVDAAKSARLEAKRLARSRLSPKQRRRRRDQKLQRRQVRRGKRRKRRKEQEAAAAHAEFARAVPKDVVRAEVALELRQSQGPRRVHPAFGLGTSGARRILPQDLRMWDVARESPVYSGYITFDTPPDPVLAMFGDHMRTDNVKPIEECHPAWNTACREITRAPPPDFRLTSPVFLGYRRAATEAEVDKAMQARLERQRLELISTFDNAYKPDQRLPCHVCCGWGRATAGCPCCGSRKKGDSKAEALFNFQAAAQIQDSLSRGQVSQGDGEGEEGTTMTIAQYERSKRQVPIHLHIKALPAGGVVRMVVDRDESIRYVYFLYRSLAGPEGMLPNMRLYVPTVFGFVCLSDACLKGSATVAAYDPASFSLNDYSMRSRDAEVAMLQCTSNGNRSRAMMTSFLIRNLVLTSDNNAAEHERLKRRMRLLEFCSEVTKPVSGKTDDMQALLLFFLKSAAVTRARTKAAEQERATQRRQKRLQEEFKAALQEKLRAKQNESAVNIAMNMFTKRAVRRESKPWEEDRGRNTPTPPAPSTTPRAPGAGPRPDTSPHPPGLGHGPSYQGGKELLALPPVGKSAGEGETDEQRRARGMKPKRKTLNLDRRNMRERRRSRCVLVNNQIDSSNKSRRGGSSPGWQGKPEARNSRSGMRRSDAKKQMTNIDLKRQAQLQSLGVDAGDQRIGSSGSRRRTLNIGRK